LAKDAKKKHKERQEPFILLKKGSGLTRIEQDYTPVFSILSRTYCICPITLNFFCGNCKKKQKRKANKCPLLCQKGIGPDRDSNPGPVTEQIHCIQVRITRSDNHLGAFVSGRAEMGGIGGYIHH